MVAFVPRAWVFQVFTGVLSAIDVVPFNKSERSHSCKFGKTPPGPLVKAAVAVMFTM